MTVRLDPGHIYRRNDNNEVVPGVTGTLRAAGVVDYSMISQDVLQAAAWRGTRVHRAMHYYVMDTLDTSSLDPEIAGYVAAGIRFHEQSNLIPAQYEQIVYNEQYNYAGMFDLTCVIQDELWCIDWKSGIILDGHRAQLAAYTACLPGPRRFRRAAVQLKADGTYTVHQFKRADYERDLDLFLFALAGQKTTVDIA